LWGKLFFNGKEEVPYDNGVVPVCEREEAKRVQGRERGWEMRVGRTKGEMRFALKDGHTKF
jgi:hypothetical protein